MRVLCKTVLFKIGVLSCAPEPRSFLHNKKVIYLVFGGLSGQAKDFTGSNLILNCLAPYTIQSQERGTRFIFHSTRIADMPFHITGKLCISKPICTLTSANMQGCGNARRVAMAYLLRSLILC